VPAGELPAAILGTWVSGVRESPEGAMTFVFRIDADRIEMTGTPVEGSSAEVFRRSGPYRLEGEHLITPALNDGRPIAVAVRGAHLAVTIDDGLSFRLRRQ
jgi:hypothetical protein